MVLRVLAYVEGQFMASGILKASLRCPMVVETFQRGGYMVHPTPGCQCRQGSLSLEPLDTGVMPQKIHS